MTRTLCWFRWLGIPAVLILLLAARAPLFAQSGAPRYYYYQGTRIPLEIDPRFIAVRFSPTASVESQQSLIDRAGDVEDFNARVQEPVGGLVILRLRAGSDPLAAAARLTGQTGVSAVAVVYSAGNSQLVETGEFLARFQSTRSDAEIAAFNRAHNVTLVRRQPNSDRVLVLAPGPGSTQSARELANAYVEAGVVEFAEPDFLVRAPRPAASGSPESGEMSVTPSDANFNLQWSLKNTGQFLGAIPNDDINATNAWSITQGASSIKIAVIDEGVDASHPELAGKVLTGYNSLNGSSNTTPNVNDYHGTGVAGLIAANSNNGAGIAGVCWFCRILPVKVAERDSQGNWTATFQSLAAGIDWAWQNGADVLNNSWTMDTPSDSVQLALLNARTGGRGGLGSTIVFAAGNDNANTVAFPASLNSYVIAVGASNWCDQRKTPTNNRCNNNNPTWGSNYGSALDLVAPGEALYSTCNGNQCTNGAYTYLSGTSVAAPLVSGAVGLIYSLNPNLTPDKVQQTLQKGARDIGAAGKDNETGHGRLDAYNTLAQLYNLSIAVSGSGTLVQPGATVAYTLSYANTGYTAMGATLINVTLPAHTSYVSSSPAFSPQGGGIYQLSLGTLPGSTTGTATFRVQVQPSAAGQPITLNATIQGAFPESFAGDNSASVTSLGIASRLYLPFIERNATP